MKEKQLNRIIDKFDLKSGDKIVNIEGYIYKVIKDSLVPLQGGITANKGDKAKLYNSSATKIAINLLNGSIKLPIITIKKAEKPIAQPKSKKKNKTEEEESEE